VQQGKAIDFDNAAAKKLSFTPCPSTMIFEGNKKKNQLLDHPVEKVVLHHHFLDQLPRRKTGLDCLT
jgi:hypothetical protein